MKGFSNEALLLFPKLDNYIVKSDVYKRQFRMALANLNEYLRRCNITPYCFYTDDVARQLFLNGMKWDTPLTMAERFFAKTKCEGMGMAMGNMREHPDLCAQAEEKYPTSIDASDILKMEVIEKHIKFVTEKVIKSQSIVFDFRIGRRSQYKVDIVRDAPKIRVLIDTRTYVPETYVGDSLEASDDVFGVPYANRSMENWGLV